MSGFDTNGAIPGAEHQGPALTNPPASPYLIRLQRAVLRLPQPAFAVLDGAQWQNLPEVLEQLGLYARSLFLGANEDVAAAGPWLVALGQRERAADDVLTLLGERPAAVFWGCQAGDAALWHHLRILSQVRLARLPGDATPAADQVDGNGPDTPGAGGPQPPRSGSEVVLFRHWDPRTFGSVLPLLDEAQFARVIGVADEIVLLDPPALGGLGLRRVVRDADLPMAPRGRLSLDAGQVAALDETMRERSHRRVALSLREAAPDEAATLDDAGLYRFVRASEAEGQALGLRSERAQGQWAYLALSTGGTIGREPAVRRYVARGGGLPDTNLDRLFEQMQRLARADSGGIG